MTFAEYRSSAYDAGILSGNHPVPMLSKPFGIGTTSGIEAERRLKNNFRFKTVLKFRDKTICDTFAFLRRPTFEESLCLGFID